MVYSCKVTFWTGNLFLFQAFARVPFVIPKLCPSFVVQVAAFANESLSSLIRVWMDFDVMLVQHCHIQKLLFTDIAFPKVNFGFVSSSQMLLYV